MDTGVRLTVTALYSRNRVAESLARVSTRAHRTSAPLYSHAWYLSFVSFVSLMSFPPAHPVTVPLTASSHGTNPTYPRPYSPRASVWSGQNTRRPTSSSSHPPSFPRPALARRRRFGSKASSVSLSESLGGSTRCGDVVRRFFSGDTLPVCRFGGDSLRTEEGLELDDDAESRSRTRLRSGRWLLCVLLWFAEEGLDALPLACLLLGCEWL